MGKTAVFPGSFDPFTIGHQSLIKRGLDIFDKIIIAVGINSQKKGFMPIEKRLELIKSVFQGEKRVEVKTFSNLTVDFCKENKARHILRGIRSSTDYEYEHSIAEANRLMSPEIETVFILALPEYTSLSSSVVREIISYKRDARKFLPAGINYEYFFNYNPDIIQ
ncbi:MAG: pantetheine-phosphate adenylyltransferase [Bacteroidales bacterium]|jgi:pantetheine-phosphate adenylyltransferase|nr:pantetheine-phosphate adenylyltransferase [Bacteroidales bacterium]